MLQEWHREGGVLLVGYEQYRNLAAAGRVKNKKQRELLYRQALVTPTCSASPRVSSLPPSLSLSSPHILSASLFSKRAYSLGESILLDASLFSISRCEFILMDASLFRELRVYSLHVALRPRSSTHLSHIPQHSPCIQNPQRHPSSIPQNLMTPKHSTMYLAVKGPT